MLANRWRKRDTYGLCERRWKSKSWQIVKAPKTDQLPNGSEYLLIGPIGQSWPLQAKSRPKAFAEAKGIIKREIHWYEDIVLQMSAQMNDYMNLEERTNGTC